MRLTIEGDLDAEREDEVTQGLQKTLAQVSSTTDVEALKEKMRSTAARCHQHFRDIIEIPAES